MRTRLSKLVLAASGALVVCIVAPVSAEAAPDPATAITVSSGVLYDNCVDQPFDLSGLSDWSSDEAHAWGNVFGYYNYDVDLTVLGPDGTEDDTDFVTRRADDMREFGEDSGEFYLCGGPGTYTAQVQGYWCPLDWSPSGHAADCQDLKFEKSFTMRAAKTAVTVKAATKSVSFRKTKSVKVASTVKVERSTGYFQAANVEVALQYKRGSKWVTWDSRSTNSKGLASFKVKFAGPGKFVFRSKVLTDGDYYAGATSKTTVVKVKR